MRAAFRVLIVAGASLLAPVTLACGFEDPASMQTGILNWVYPDALHVNTAVWQAQLDDRIGTDPPLQTTSKLLVNPGFRKATRTLGDFANHIADPQGDSTKQSFVVLLIEAMLWSQITIEDGRASVLTHVNAPAEQEAVIITHRVVLEAISQGRMSPRNAVDLGLLKLYGSEAAIARTMAIFDRSTVASSAKTSIQ